MRKIISGTLTACMRIGCWWERGGDWAAASAVPAVRPEEIRWGGWDGVREFAIVIAMGIGMSAFPIAALIASAVLIWTSGG